MDRSFLPRVAALAVAAALGVGMSPPSSWAQSSPHDHHASAVNETAIASEQPFLNENNTAMDKMMAGMEVKPTGDVDADFTDMMIPHHQGAIDMAVAYLRYGKNEQLRRIAQEIIVDQQQEIAAMNLALGRPLPASEASPTQPTAPMTSGHSGHDTMHMK